MIYDTIRFPNCFHGDKIFFTASFFLFVFAFSKRRAGHGGSDGQRKAKEGAQAPDHLLQLPAGRAAEEVPVSTVPGPAGASRAGGTAGPHADTGQAPEENRSEIFHSDITHTA